MGHSREGSPELAIAFNVKINLDSESPGGSRDMRVCIVSFADANAPYGGFTRPVWLGEELAGLGHDVLHLCPGPPAIAGSLVEYRPIAKSVLATPFRSLFQHNVHLLLERSDVLYVHQLANLHFLPLRCSHVMCTVLDAHGSAVMENEALGRQMVADKYQLLESVSVWASSAVVAASVELEHFVRTRYKTDGSRTFVVPNGVAVTMLKQPWSGEAWRARLGLGEREVLVLHVAPPTFAANEMSLELLSSVAALSMSRTMPPRFVVAGRKEGPANILPLGHVDDYIGLVDAADIAVLPYPSQAICGGARNKTLEFLARGKAIVSTHEGLRGVPEARPGVHYLQAEEPVAFASCISELSSSPEKRATLGIRARELAGNYLWARQAQRLSDSFTSLLEGDIQR